MNFHFHNKCRPTTCFKHYNAHKFILFTVYPPSTFLVHTVSIYPSGICWCHFCLTWGIRVINHIALLQLWTAGVSIWGWVTAWRQKLASTSLHCPCHIIIGWKPALGKDIIRCVQAGLAYLGQNPSIAARQCPHFHLCVVRRERWKWEWCRWPGSVLEFDHINYVLQWLSYSWFKYWGDYTPPTPHHCEDLRHSNNRQWGKYCIIILQMSRAKRVTQLINIIWELFRCWCLDCLQPEPLDPHNYIDRYN